jgi:hypothetical protein
MQIRLRNNTGGTSKIGQQVKLVVNSHTAFIKANFWDDGIIGTVAQSVPNGNSCWVNLLNTVTWSDIIDAPEIPVGVDISGKVDKVTGKSLVADSEIAKIHSAHSDDQDLSSYASNNFAIAMSVAL